MEQEEMQDHPPALPEPAGPPPRTDGFYRHPRHLNGGGEVGELPQAANAGRYL